jgi:hypothetical protein
MASLLDICRFVPSTSGTSDFIYSETVQGYQSPLAAGIVNGKTYKYRAESSDLAQWEVGEGTYNSGTGTLVRTTILYNSLGTTAKINFSAPPQIAYIVLKGELQALDKKNYIINGAMMVSQEFPLTVCNIDRQYPVDMFQLGGSGGYLVNCQQVLSTSPAGSPYRLRSTITQADTTITTTEFLLIRYAFEGWTVVDLKPGTALAKTVTLRFGCRGPAGTYCVTFRNFNGSVSDRSYISDFVISAGEANTDIIRTITLPLDITGSWPTTNVLCIMIEWVLMAGPTLRGFATGSWIAATTAVASANLSNFVGTVGNVFELFDVGLYEGNTIPEFSVPDYASTLQRCKRYWETGPEKISYYGIQMGQYFDTYRFTVEKRVAPTMSWFNFQIYNTSSVPQLFTPTINQVFTMQFEFVIPTACTGNYVGGIWKANARMI